jgi:hypothetical protein
MDRSRKGRQIEAGWMSSRGTKAEARADGETDFAFLHVSINVPYHLARVSRTLSLRKLT